MTYATAGLRPADRVRWRLCERKKQTNRTNNIKTLSSQSADGFRRARAHHLHVPTEVMYVFEETVSRVRQVFGPELSDNTTRAHGTRDDHIVIMSTHTHTQRAHARALQSNHDDRFDTLFVRETHCRVVCDARTVSTIESAACRTCGMCRRDASSTRRLRAIQK